MECRVTKTNPAKDKNKNDHVTFVYKGTKKTNACEHIFCLYTTGVISLEVRQDDIKQEGAMDLKYLQGHK